jgi:hypothetical protein
MWALRDANARRTAATGHRDPEWPVGWSSLRLSPEFLSADLCCLLRKLFVFR